MTAGVEVVKGRRRLGAGVALLLTLVLGFGALAGYRLRQLASTGGLEAMLGERLSEELGMKVSVATAAVRGLTTVLATELDIVPPPESLPIHARGLAVSLSGWALLTGGIEAVALDLEGIDLDLAADGRAAQLLNTLSLIEQRARRHKPAITVTEVRVTVPNGRLDGKWLVLDRPAGDKRSFRMQAVWTPAGLGPAAVEVRAALGGTPFGFAGTTRCRGGWIDVELEGGVGDLRGMQTLDLGAKLRRVDLGAIAAAGFGGQRGIKSGELSGALRFTGTPTSPRLEGIVAPTAVVVALPVGGAASVQSGTARLADEIVRCEALQVESRFGTFVVTGTVAGPWSDPVLDLNARCRQVPLAALTETAGAGLRAEGTGNLELTVQRSLSRPDVRGRLGVTGAMIRGEVPGIGDVNVRIASGSVTYERGRLASRGIEISVWGTPALIVFDGARLDTDPTIALEARATDVEIGRLARNLPPEYSALLAPYRLRGRSDLTLQLAGTRSRPTVVGEATMAGLEFTVPVEGGAPVPIAMTGGSLTLARSTLFGHRLEGTAFGSRFVGDVAVSDVLGTPRARGEFLVRRLRLDAVAPAAARKYSLRGAPDVKVELGDGGPAAFVASAEARGLALTLPLSGGGAIPIGFVGGQLKFRPGALAGQQLKGDVAGGHFEGELMLADPLTAPKASGKAALRRVQPSLLLPALAPGALGGTMDATLAFDPAHTTLECSLAGLVLQQPGAAGGAALRVVSGRASLGDRGARFSAVELAAAPPWTGTASVSGVAAHGAMNLDVACRDVEVATVTSLVAPAVPAWRRRFAFAGKIESRRADPVLRGTFTLGADATSRTTASRFLEGVQGALTWDGLSLTCPKIEIGPCTASLTATRGLEGTEVHATLKAKDIDHLLARLGPYAGIAHGAVDCAMTIRSDAASGGQPRGKGHAVLSGLVVDGKKAATLAGIQNVSSRLRGAGGFLSLGLLPGFWSLPGQVAAGQLHMNAEYAEFAFSEHALGTVRWDFKVDKGVLEGPLKSAPDPACVSGTLVCDLSSGYARGRGDLASSRGKVSLKAKAIEFDAAKTPPVRAPEGLKSFEFTGAGDAFSLAGTAGGAIVGGLLKGGAVTLGPASLVPMLFMGNKRPHKPYKGLPGTRPSAAEATVITTHSSPPTRPTTGR